ncbi:MAG: hypothetical protein Q9164_002345, partial [Protoblastenia rupestris]
MALSWSSSMSLPTTLVLLSLTQFSIAQLSTCGAVNCPLDQYSRPGCVVGNTTASELGISSFTSSLSPQPLTWTIAVQSVGGPLNTFERNFFIGTPPSLNLTASGSSQSQACALFFEGVAAYTEFPGTDPAYDQGTCDDALTQGCVNDIRTQAQTELVNIRSGSGENDSSSPAFVCGKLGETLRDKAPTTCTVASDGRWGDILVRPLTGGAAASPIKQGECHPTTGKDYNLTLAASNRVDAPSRNTTEVGAILFGVTPIMTIVYKGDEPEPEIDLSCLKTIGPKANTTYNE